MLTLKPTKWVETLRSKPSFLRFTDFKREKYSFYSPIPFMQCCATVRAPAFNEGDMGGVCILLLSEVILFEYNVSIIMSPIVCSYYRIALTSAQKPHYRKPIVYHISTVVSA